LEKEIRKILVTGGAGFIGSSLVRRLVKEGYEVTVIDNLSRGKAKNLKDILDKITFIQHDLREPITLDRFDVVFDLAAKVYGITKLYENEADFIRSNLLILLNTLEAVKSKIKHYFYFSSSCVYNFEECPLPHKEEDANRIPKTAYDISKRFGEEIVKIYAKQFSFFYTIIRPFNIYGEEESEEAPHVITDFFNRLKEIKSKGLPKKFWMLGSGQQTRSFTYKEDLVDALLFLMKTKKSQNETFNVGTGEEVTINKLLDLIFEVIGEQRNDWEIEHRPPIPQDVQKRCPDVSKLKSLGWRPKYNLRKGLEKVAEYYGLRR